MKTAEFSVSGVSELQQASGKSWLEFLNLPSMSMGVYRVPSGSNDRDSHEPHDRDEVYVCSSGSGLLTADGRRFEMQAGAIVFVKAGVEHHFHDVTDDLTVLVFFAGSA